MEYIVILLAAAVCMLMAYCLMKIKLKAFIKVLINFASLFVLGIIMVVSGLIETTLLIYIILLVLTLLGVLMRIISPIIFNLAGSFVAKITKQDYEWLTYDQLMKEKQSGNKMYFCVLTFTTLKVALYLMLVLSFIGLI